MLSITIKQQDRDVMKDLVTATGAGQDLLLQDMDVRMVSVLPLIVIKVLGLVSPNLKNCEAGTNALDGCWSGQCATTECDAGTGIIKRWLFKSKRSYEKPQLLP